MHQSLTRFSLRDLEYAVAVAELGHFGRAAERCAVSQPALSAQVRKLEEALGMVLFERTRRGVLVTAAAEPVIVQARRAIGEVRRLAEMASSVSREFSGELRLWSITTLGPYLIPYILRPIRERFPHVNLLLGEGLTDQVVEGLLKGRIDAAFLSLPLKQSGLVTEALFFEPFVAVYPRHHPLGRLRPIRVQQLDSAQLLLLEEGHCLRDQALALCGSGSSVVRHAASLETLRHLVAAGAGYSIMPALAVGNETLDGLVDYSPFAEADAGRNIALAWRSSDPRAQQFAALAEMVRVSPAVRTQLALARPTGLAPQRPCADSGAVAKAKRSR